MRNYDKASYITLVYQKGRLISSLENILSKMEETANCTLSKLHFVSAA